MTTLEERAAHVGISVENLRVIERGNEIAAELMKDNPKLPSVTAMIMGGDMASAERWMEEVRAGRVPYDEALLLTGSYARLDAALRLQEEGHATRDHLLDIWPHEWPGADPDDTDPRFVALWLEAWERNGRRPVQDEPSSKLPRGKRITVYRGQLAGAPVGLSWSLDRAIAEKFARGAWARLPVGGGEIIEMRALRSNVLAYLTGRGEQEVIIDPSTVERVT